MVDHSEFPWGPQYEPGLLTPLGVIGWVIASALLLLMLLQLRPGMGAKAGDAHLQEMHKVILAAARYALKQDEYGILQGTKVLRRVIDHYLSNLLEAGGPLGKQVKALAAGMGEKDEKDKKAKKKEDKGHGHGGHGGGSNGGHGEPAHAAAGAAGAPGVAAHTVQGHSITVNVGGENGHNGDHHEDEDAPLSLEDQLVALRKAVREFEAWWSVRHARLKDLAAARDDLTRKKPIDPAILALLEDKKHTR